MVGGSSPEGFEPTRAEHNGLAGHRLNHSAKATFGVCVCVCGGDRSEIEQIRLCRHLYPKSHVGVVIIVITIMVCGSLDLYACLAPRVSERRSRSCVAKAR